MYLINGNISKCGMTYIAIRFYTEFKYIIQIILIAPKLLETDFRKYKVDSFGLSVL